MDPAAFRTAWDAAAPPVPPELADELREAWVEFPPASLTDLPTDAAAWLGVAGLPEDAAPFLSFGRRDGPRGPLTTSWGAPPTYARFHQFGFDGGGDAICLDAEAEWAVVQVDHEVVHRPVPPRTRFVDTDLPRFAACLLAYRRAVTAAVAAGGTALDPFPPPVLDRLRTEIAAADPPAAAAGTFWGAELAHRG